MLRPSDQEYILTRKIKMGKLAMDAKFLPFAKWINEAYKVEILNIITDTINGGTIRLQLIFEFQKDVDTFLLKNRFSQSSRKAKVIEKKYNDLFDIDPKSSMLVLFYAFEPLAKQEVVTSIPLTITNSFKDRYQENLWEVVGFGQHVTFFFFSNEALQKAQETQDTSRIKEDYFLLLKPFDKFDYFSLENFHAIFDSKENFDQNYDSNWRWYYS